MTTATITKPIAPKTIKAAKAIKTIQPARIKIKTLRPLLAELERAAEWIYGLKSGDRPSTLPELVITIQTSGKKPQLWGKLASNSWSDKNGLPYHEMVICSEHLVHDPYEVYGTVIHETAHLWNVDNDIKDCSTSGRHNKKFKEAAEMFGLVVADPHNAKGFAYTSLSEQLRQEIDQDFKPDLSVFQVYRNAQAPKVTTPKAKKYEPWICECPTTIQVAAGKENFQAHCDDCGQMFERK
jgi:hypothetical protein